jgi:hypothetical protein
VHFFKKNIVPRRNWTRRTIVRECWKIGNNFKVYFRTNSSHIQLKKEYTNNDGNREYLLCSLLHIKSTDEMVIDQIFSHHCVSLGLKTPHCFQWETRNLCRCRGLGSYRWLYYLELGNGLNAKIIVSPLWVWWWKF